MRKYRTIILFAVTLCLAFTLFSAFEAGTVQKISNTQVELRLGTNLFQKIALSDSFTLAKIKPTMKVCHDSPLEVIGTPVILNSKQKDELLNLILNDSSYIFDATKRNIFIAQYAIFLKSPHGESVLLIDSANAQIKFCTDPKGTRLDYDPVKGKIESFINKIL